MITLTLFIYHRISFLRLNTKLESRQIAPMRSLATDLSDGVKLVQLMEIMGDTTLGRFYLNPRMRVQKAENVNLALEFIKSRGVVLTNVGAEDIVDGNLKLILGMIWTLILRFTIADIRYVPAGPLTHPPGKGRRYRLRTLFLCCPAPTIPIPK